MTAVTKAGDENHSPENALPVRLCQPEGDIPHGFETRAVQIGCREKVLKGATALGDAVRVTLGAKSKCVLIEKKWVRPIVCSDGVTIVKDIGLEDHEEILCGRMIRDAAE